MSETVRNLAEMGENLQKICKRLQTNQNLLKLLYYTDKDPLSQPNLTEEQIKKEVFEKLIKVVPRVGPKETAHSIVTLRVVNGIVNARNSEFVNFKINLEVFVPLTQWIIKNENLRPFLIMGEINKSLNNKKLNSMGTMQFEDFELRFLTDEVSCYAMNYGVISYE